jgi:hypothetical protein
MTNAAVAVDTERFHGRNRISSKAIRAVVSAITASELGITVKNVDVQLSDDNGGLAIGISAPIAIAALAVVRTGSSRLAVRSTSAQPTLIERVTSAQIIIRGRMLDLTGSSVGAVNIRLTGAQIQGEVRVR